MLPRHHGHPRIRVVSDFGKDALLLAPGNLGWLPGCHANWVCTALVSPPCTRSEGVLGGGPRSGARWTPCHPVWAAPRVPAVSHSHGQRSVESFRAGKPQLGMGRLAPRLCPQGQLRPPPPSAARAALSGPSQGLCHWSHPPTPLHAPLHTPCSHSALGVPGGPFLMDASWAALLLGVGGPAGQGSPGWGVGDAPSLGRPHCVWGHLPRCPALGPPAGHRPQVQPAGASTPRGASYSRTSALWKLPETCKGVGRSEPLWKCAFCVRARTVLGFARGPAGTRPPHPLPPTGPGPPPRAARCARGGGNPGTWAQQATTCPRSSELGDSLITGFIMKAPASSVPASYSRGDKLPAASAGGGGCGRLPGEGLLWGPPWEGGRIPTRGTPARGSWGGSPCGTLRPSPGCLLRPWADAGGESGREDGGEQTHAGSGACTRVHRVAGWARRRPCPVDVGGVVGVVQRWAPLGGCPLGGRRCPSTHGSCWPGMTGGVCTGTGPRRSSHRSPS